MSISYPEGNFGGNQLLDGSISLSPLYQGRMTDSHFRTAKHLQQSFLWLRPAQAQFTIFRVLTPAFLLHLSARTGEMSRWCTRCAGGGGIPLRSVPADLHLHCAMGFRCTPLTHACIRLLGPSFKTGRVRHRHTLYRKNKASQCCLVCTECCLTAGSASLFGDLGENREFKW